MATIPTQQRDRLVRNLNDYFPAPGMSALDRAMRSPGPYITRLYFSMDIDEKRRLTGPGNGELLCSGAALGLCDDGRVRHFRPYHGRQRFVGFHEMVVDVDTILVRSRGSVEIYVGPEARPGKTVYVHDVDDFSVKDSPGACGIGTVLSFVPDRPGNAIVVFKAFDDARPLELKRRRT
jgi:hypothetical protein